ncbi:MAG: hypothetical protein AB7U83_03005 [Vicinamibacterales bacterium]
MADIERIVRRDRRWIAVTAVSSAIAASALRAQWPSESVGRLVVAAAAAWLLSTVFVVLVRERLDNTLRSDAQVSRLRDVELLAAIPWIDNAADRRRRLLRRVAWAAAIVAGGLATTRLVW